MTNQTADNLRATAVRSVFWVSLEKWGSRIISLSVFATLGRLLEPKDFGLIALCAVFTTILGLFVDSGFSQVLVQRLNVTNRQVATAFWTSVGIGVVLYALLVVTAPIIADLYGEPRLESLLYVLGLSVPMTAFASTPAALLERTFEFRALFVRQISGIVIGSAAGVAAAVAGLGVWALVVQSLGGSLVSAIVLWAKSDWRPSFEFSFKDLKELLAFGTAILATDAVNLINGQADKLLVGTVLGPTELGYYYIGARLVQLVMDSLTTVISQVSLTTFSRLQTDPPRLLRAYLKATSTSSSLAFPAYAALAILAPVLVPLVFGAKWDQSIVLMQLMIPGAALASVLYFDKSVLLARGFGRDAFLLATSNSLLSISLLFAAAPWGATGIALSRSLRQFIFWPVRLCVLRRRIGLVFGPYMHQFLRPIVASAVTVVPVMIAYTLLPERLAVRGPLLLVVAAAAYLLAIWLVARSDVDMVIGAFKKRGSGGRVKVAASPMPVPNATSQRPRPEKLSSMYTRRPSPGPSVRRDASASK